MRLREIIALTAFWGSVGLIIYTYLLYPLILAIRATLSPQIVHARPYIPNVSIIIAVYNEEDVMAAKIENSLAFNYPADKLEIIVASNGSEDRTNDIVAEYAGQHENVQLIALPEKGKNRAVNAAAAAATGDILLFTDADSMLSADSIMHVVANMSDPTVGGVGGDYEYVTETGEGVGERTYWDFDRILKQIQSNGGSMTSATGQLYAIRRELFKTIPNGVTDDFFTSTQVPSAHLRLVFEPKALAQGPVADSRGEFRRKVRVMTRGLNSVKAQRHLLNPLQYGFYAIQLFSHKILRRTMFIPLIGMFISAPFLWANGWLYQLATVGQFGLYGAGWLGYRLQDSDNPMSKSKLFTLPYFFCMVNFAAYKAVRNVLQGESFDVWNAERGGSGNLSQTPMGDQK